LKFGLIGPVRTKFIIRSTEIRNHYAHNVRNASLAVADIAKKTVREMSGKSTATAGGFFPGNLIIVPQKLLNRIVNGCTFIEMGNAFDPAKDGSNIADHGISPARTKEMVIPARDR
jgi:hypothetical protein